MDERKKIDKIPTSDYYPTRLHARWDTTHLLPVTICCFYLQHFGHQNEGKYYRWNWVDLTLENI